MINSDEEKKRLRQNFVFSATLTLIHELPKHLRNKKQTKNLTTEEKLQQVNQLPGFKWMSDFFCPIGESVSRLFIHLHLAVNWLVKKYVAY
jgi:hypothetical protein